MAKSKAGTKAKDTRRHGGSIRDHTPKLDTFHQDRDPRHGSEAVPCNATISHDLYGAAPGSALIEDFPSMDYSSHMTMDRVFSQPECHGNQMHAPTIGFLPTSTYDMQSCCTSTAMDPVLGLSDEFNSSSIGGFDYHLAHDANSGGTSPLYTTHSMGYSGAFPDGMSINETSGSHPMCSQTSSSGISDYTAAWSNQGSSPGFPGVSMPHVIPEAHLNMTTSNFGSSLSPQSQESYIATPSSMHPMEESYWSTNEALSHDFPRMGTFASHGAQGYLSFAPGVYTDQRFDFCSDDEISFDKYHSTVRPGPSHHRTTLPDADAWQPAPTQSYAMNQYAGLITPSRRSSEGESTSTARRHHFYQCKTSADGLFHCPYETTENCKHAPEKLKCNYDKHLDSHLKPYRCRNAECSILKFSSTACLLRHEREAHGLHGHGEKPYLCLFRDCDRSQPTQGFPRQWNLRDHMKRVHNYVSSENSEHGYPSPPASPNREEESEGLSRRKRSPDLSQVAKVKKVKAGTPTAVARKGSQSIQSDREELKRLQVQIERKYGNSDISATSVLAEYQADVGRLHSLLECIRRKETSRKGHQA